MTHPLPLRDTDLEGLLVLSKPHCFPRRVGLTEVPCLGGGCHKHSVPALFPPTELKNKGSHTRASCRVLLWIVRRWTTHVKPTMWTWQSHTCRGQRTTSDISPHLLPCLRLSCSLLPAQMFLAILLSPRPIPWNYRCVLYCVWFTWILRM